jgi:hypothetical protein
MSKFVTSLPLDIEAIKELLPAGSDFSSVEWNKAESRLDFFWEHDKLKTPFTFAHPVSLEALQCEELPREIRDLRPKGLKTPEPEPIPESVPAETGTIVPLPTENQDPDPAPAAETGTIVPPEPVVDLGQAKAGTVDVPTAKKKTAAAAKPRR